MSRTLFVMMLALLFPALAQAGEPTYALKLYVAKPGDKVSLSKSTTGVSSIVLDIGGKKEETLKIGEKIVYTEEILEKPAGAPRATKVRRTYDTAEKFEKSQPKRLPYHGQTVLIEKTGEAYEFTMNGEKLTGADAEELDKRFNGKNADFQNSDFLPPGPVKVGESWSMKQDKIVRAFGEDGRVKIDPDRSTLTAKLVRIGKRDNRLMGVIEITAKIAVTEITIGGGKAGGDKMLPLSKESYSKQTLVIETPIDGSAGTETISAVVDIRLEALLPKGTVLFTTQSKGTSTETTTPK